MRVEGEKVGAIGSGLVVLVGVAEGDGPAEAAWLAEKLSGLRVFRDDGGTMNRSVSEAGGAVLLISQFTLLGDARRGRRPSYVAAARPEIAEPLLRSVAERLRTGGLEVAEGRFGAMMDVELVNDGPVTILLDSEKKF